MEFLRRNDQHRTNYLSDDVNILEDGDLQYFENPELDSRRAAAFWRPDTLRNGVLRVPFVHSGGASGERLLRLRLGLSDMESGSFKGRRQIAQSGVIKARGAWMENALGEPIEPIRRVGRSTRHTAAP